MTEYPSSKTPISLGFQQAQIYSFLDFDPDDYEQTHRRPPMKNLFAAAIYVAKLIRNAGFDYALLGGAAMAALGASRETMDVDIGTNAKMSNLWSILDDPRAILPDTKLMPGMIRFFVHTGPDYGDDFVEENTEVQVDIMIAGGNSIPRHMEDYIQAVDLQVGSLPVQLASLNPFALLRAKLSSFSARQSPTDFTDCCFLLANFELSSERANELDAMHRKDFVESGNFAELESGEAQFYRTKLQV